MLAALLNTDVLWRNALAVVPLAVVAALLCRILPCKPATRHMLWLVVLLVLFLPPGVPRFLPPPAAEQTSVATPAADPRLAAKPALLAGEAVHQSTEVTVAPVRPEGRPPASALLAIAPPLEQQPLAHSPTPRLAIEPALIAEPRQLGHVAELPMLKSWGRGPAAASIASDDRLEQVSSNTPPARRQVADEKVATTAAPVPQASETVESHRSALATDPGPRLATPLAANAPVPAVLSKASVRQRFGAAIGVWAARARQWWAQANRVVDAASSAPPLPSGLWLAGSIGLAAIAAVRTWRHAGMLRRASAAPAAVESMVREVADSLGLRRAPEALMVAARVSPMIWCGRRARLILPAELWDELDEAGRRAVIVHELAHLKRRDHWVCWAELIAVAVYWWHPVVWIVRRRLREEADLCCDAWVTMSLPRSRRAYAEALLETRRFISEAKAAPPAVGLGAISGRARHFARRLTMVMTQRTAPGRSISGMILALTLGAAGVLSAPLMACPPEDGKETKEKQTAKALAEKQAAKVLAERQAAKAADLKAEMKARAQAERELAAEAERRARAAAPRPPQPPSPPRAARAPRAAVAPVPPQPPEAMEQDASTFERHLEERRAQRAPAAGARGGGASSSQNATGDLEKRLDRLERQLDELNRRMDQMLRRLERQSAAPGMPQIPSTTNAASVPLTALTVAGVESNGRAVVVIVRPEGTVLAYQVPEEKLASLRTTLADAGQPTAVEWRGLTATTPSPAGLYGSAQSELQRAISDQQRAFVESQVDLARRLYAQVLDQSQDSHNLREHAASLDRYAEAIARHIDEAVASAERLQGTARARQLDAVQLMTKQLRSLEAAAERLNEQANKLENEAEEIDEVGEIELDLPVTVVGQPAPGRPTAVTMTSTAPVTVAR